MKVVILAGGLGTRLQEETSIKPKPMLEIGGHPLVWHIMHIYATYGYKEFILALGYKAEIIKNYFLNYQALSSDISIDLSNHKVTIHQQENEGWNLHLVDTGLRTETGGRMKRLSHHLKSEPFMMTYGDGVSDINITDLVTFHKNHGKLVTVTAVRPPARFGSLEIHGSLVTHFAEKPQTGEGWINGGFFVIEPEALNYIEDDSTPWERDPLEKLVQEKQVVAYQHEGFWQGMDTLRDLRFLESLWSEDKAPWKVWN